MPSSDLDDYIAKYVADRLEKMFGHLADKLEGYAGNPSWRPGFMDEIRSIARRLHAYHDHGAPHADPRMVIPEMQRALNDLGNILPSLYDWRGGLGAPGGADGSAP